MFATRFLFCFQIEKFVSGSESIFEEIPVDMDRPSDDQRRFRLKPSLSLHFYTSSSPCGDAADFDRRVPSLTDLVHDEPSVQNFAPEYDAYLWKHQTANS